MHKLTDKEVFFFVSPNCTRFHMLYHPFVKGMVEMKTGNTWYYQKVTSEVFRKLQACAHQQGVELPYSPSGKFIVTLATCKIGFSYAWDVRLGKLSIRCDSKPIFVSTSLVKNYADQMICQCGGMKI